MNMNMMLKKFLIAAFLLPVMVGLSHAADAPEVDKSAPSSQFEHYLLFGTNLSDAYFQSKRSGGWCGEGFDDCARKDHWDYSYTIGYGIELQSTYPSVSHAFEISYTPIVISGSETVPSNSRTMYFDVENQFNLEYNYIYKLSQELDVLPLVGISNFDFIHNQTIPPRESDFSTQNVTKLYIGAGIRKNLNESISLKLSYKLYENFHSDLLTDPNNFGARDPAMKDFSQLSASLIYKY